MVSPVRTSPARVTPNGPNVTRTPAPRVVLNLPPIRRQPWNYGETVPAEPRYRRFAPLDPPITPNRAQFQATNAWILRFSKLTGDDDLASAMAKKRKIVFGLAAITAGAGFILGAALMMATHQGSSTNKTGGQE